MNHRDTKTQREEILGEFVEEVWDAVCRMRVGSGLSTREVLRALDQVKVLVGLGEGEDLGNLE